jgi:ABC-type Na+ efflux pump permease subunit
LDADHAFHAGSYRQSAKEEVMNDPQRLDIIKSIIWNVLMFLFVVALLVTAAYIGGPLIREAPSAQEKLEILILIVGIPAFVVMVAWDRVPREAVGAMLAALIGFGLAKIG